MTAVLTRAVLQYLPQVRLRFIEGFAPATPSRAGGPLDHVALKARDLAATRAALRAAGVPFDESALKDTRLHQVFLCDPLGLRVELNFDLDIEEAARTTGL